MQVKIPLGLNDYGNNKNHLNSRPGKQAGDSPSNLVPPSSSLYRNFRSSHNLDNIGSNFDSN